MSRLSYALGALLLSSLLIALYGIWIEPYDLEVRHVWIRNQALSSALDNRVVVHLSDLHIDKIGKREEKVLTALERLDPDIIVLTGDYVAWKSDYNDALHFLSKLHAKIGVWAVMGDYDYSETRKSCLFCHEAGTGRRTRQHEVHFLRDTAEKIHFPGGSLVIAGLDAEGDSEKAKNDFQPYSQKGTPLLLLSHSPLNFDMFSDHDDLVMLAGDTHGGQFPLPAWLFGLMGYKKNAVYNQGLFEQGRKQMFVTKGIGTTHLPIRFLRQPEILVLHFTPE